MARPSIIIGVTGGIAAYKIPHLVRLLRKKGAETKVVLTRNAQPLVGIEALRTLSGYPVYLEDTSTYDMDHIRLTRWADLLLIAPATANTIAKLAHGIADNLLTSLACAFPADRTVIAPAMNTAMWNNSATRENIDRLRGRGITVLPVGVGELACGDEGPGRMIEIEQIADAVDKQWHSGRPLAGRRVLISSGPTEEPVDPVRVITNRSSGKMGAALAAEALRLGAGVTVVSGPAMTPLPQGVMVIPVRTAAEMEQALHGQFAQADICIMAAAVSDYRPATVAQEKMHREESGRLSLELVANNDILAGLGKVKQHRLLVGFALESNGDVERAREKMERKKCDVMVFNRVDAALGTDTTDITVIDRNGGVVRIHGVSKSEAAEKLFSHIIELSGSADE